MPARRNHRYVETSAYLAMLARLVTNGGHRVGDGDTDELRQLLELRDLLDDAIVDAVRGLRASGTTWSDIGAAAGTTGQAATMRWGPKL
jgi:hypothetical protein